MANVNARHFKLSLEAAVGIRSGQNAAVLGHSVAACEVPENVLRPDLASHHSAFNHSASRSCRMIEVGRGKEHFC